MAPSSENLDLLPVLARAAEFSRGSIAPAYHYSLRSISVVDWYRNPGRLRTRRASYSIAVMESPLQWLGRQSARQTSVEPTTSPPSPLSSAK